MEGVAEIMGTITLIRGTIIRGSLRPWENMLYMCCLHQSVHSTCASGDVLTPPQFIAQAEEKISQCITIPIDPEPQIEQICGPGVDPTFDQLISALGHIASQKPKPLIDSMMLWRKNKSDIANDARIKLQQVCPASQISKMSTHFRFSLEAMLFQANSFEGIRSHPICFQNQIPWQFNHQSRHARSFSPKPNVALPPRSIYCVEF